MIRWPAPDRVSKISAGILERFKKTAAAKELEQDPREWSLVSWSWMPDPPYTVTMRCDVEERYLVMEADGRWQLRSIRPSSPPHAA